MLSLSVNEQHCPLESTVLCDFENPRKIKSAPVTPDKPIKKLLIKKNFLQKYKLYDEKLGKGASAIVKKCKRKSDKKKFAVKIIDKSNLTQRQLHLIQQEISILQTLKDKKVRNISGIIDYFDEKLTIYIVMELAELNLFEWLLSRFDGDKFKINEKKCAFIFFQIIIAIHGCHKAGIIHRDIKPENILILNKKKLKVCLSDFGLSTYKTNMKTICGTPTYLAPEIILKQQYTSKCDYWSAGVLLYVLLSGTYPFCDPNVSKLYRKIMRNEYNFDDNRWNHISMDARDLITCLLDPNPKTRYSFNKIVQHPWMRQHLF